MTPSVRLILRALITFLATAAVQLQQSDALDVAVVKGAIVGGILAALEVLTPVNKTVGVGK